MPNLTSADLYTAFGQRLVESLVKTDKEPTTTDTTARVEAWLSEAVAYAISKLKAFYDLTIPQDTWDASLKMAIYKRAMGHLTQLRPFKDAQLTARQYFDTSEQFFLDAQKSKMYLSMPILFRSGGEVVGDGITDGVPDYYSLCVNGVYDQCVLASCGWKWGDYSVLVCY